jgi:membrane-associated protease RseP (regulator of RpoE activity)
MRSSKRATLIGLSAALALVLGSLLVGAAPAAEGEKEARPWLGVALSFDEEEGQVRIVRVYEESPAEEAGLRVGDRVVSADGQELSGADGLVSLVGDSSPGDRLELVLLGEGDDRRTVVVTLGERPDDFVWAAAGLAGLETLKGLEHLENLGDHFTFDFDCEGEDCEDRLLVAGAMPHMLLGGGMAKSYLGVELSQPSDQLREYFGAREDEGVLVNRVLKGSPADHAGLQAGDLILALEGDPVASSGDLVKALREREPGESVGLSVLRDRSRREIIVELGENPHFEKGLQRFYFSDPDGASLELLEEERLREIQESARGSLENSRMAYREALDRAREERKVAFESQRAYSEAMRERMRERVRERFDEQKMQERLERLREELELLREGLEEEHLKLLRHREEHPGMPAVPTASGRNLLLA